MDLLPVECQGQQNAWMSTEIQFHDSFVPTVRRKLSSLGLEQKAVLVLNNSPAHPNAEDLVSEDGKIIAHYNVLATKCYLLDPANGSRCTRSTQASIQKENLEKAPNRRREWRICCGFFLNLWTRKLQQISLPNLGMKLNIPPYNSWRKIIASSVQQPDQDRETLCEEQSSGEHEGKNSSGDVGEKESSEDQGSFGDAGKFIDAFQHEKR